MFLKTAWTVHEVPTVLLRTKHIIPSTCMDDGHDADADLNQQSFAFNYST